MPLHRPLSLRLTPSSLCTESAIPRAALLLLAACMLLSPRIAAQTVWEQMKDFKGGIVTALEPHPDGRIYAGTLGSGIFVSVDEGKSWTPKNTGLDARDVHDILIDSDQALYVGTSEAVYKSTNGGDSWFHSSNGLTQPGVNALLQTRNGAILAGTEGRGIFITTNGGANWSNQSNAMSVFRVTALAMDAGGIVYAGTVNKGVYSSKDGGSTWVSRGSGAGAITALAARGAAELFVASSNTGCFRTLDTGRTWTPISDGLTCPDIRAIAVSATGTVYAGSTDACSGFGGMFKSTTSGDSWVAITKGMFSRSVRSILPYKAGLLLCGMQGDGVYASSNDGAQWNPSSEGLHAVTVQGLATDVAGAIYASTLGAGIYRSRDGGLSWTRQNVGLNNVNVGAIAASPTGDVYAATEDVGPLSGGVMRSSDGGDNWWKANTGLPAGIRMISLAAGPEGGVYAGTQSNYLYRSTNFGASWYQISGWEAKTVACIDVDEFANVYAGTYGVSGAYVSTNAGAVFVQRKVGMTDFNISAIRAVSNRLCFAGTSSGILYRSTNQGELWTTVRAGNGIRAKTIAGKEGSKLYVGFDGLGVFVTADEGVSGSEMNAGLTDLHVMALTEAADGSVLAGTYGGGVFRAAATTGVEESPSRDAVLNLGAFPDPFTASTRVSWTLPAASHITLRVHDALGRVVATLFDGEAPTGPQSVSFNPATDAPRMRSGAHFLVLSGSERSVVRVVHFVK
ncbi:MAG: hypothetical protein IPP94_17345 [Ignavibacteria bacterium]|nr:hypothetical protein [Ignavibacteria bacterium]